MKTRLFIIAFSILTFISCNHTNNYIYGVGPSDTELGCIDVYLCKGDTIMWSPTGNNQDEVLGTFFHYHEGDSVKTKFLWSSTWRYSTIIKGHIIDHISDENYLLADQKPVDSIWGKYIYIYNDDGSYSYSRREYDTTHHYDKRRKQLEDTPTIHYYWIMVVKTADVYGPFSYEDYLDMKKQLGVPPTLMLKHEKERLKN